MAILRGGRTRVAALEIDPVPRKCHRQIYRQEFHAGAAGGAEREVTAQDRRGRSHVHREAVDLDCRACANAMEKPPKALRAERCKSP